MHLISPKTEETVLLRSAKEGNKTKKGHKNRKKTKGSKAHKSSSGARHGGSGGFF